MQPPSLQRGDAYLDDFAAAQVWALLLRLLNQLPKSTKGKRDVRKSVFWASHQRFFKTMLIAAKVGHHAGVGLTQ